MNEESFCFISQELLERRLVGGELFKDGTYDIRCFSKSGASYDLRLGREVLITPEKESRFLENNQTINIEPGQFAVLMTEEYLKMPNDLLGFITIRFTYKSKGLVNISGFHVDPGFQGHLVFSVYNIGPSAVTLRRKDKVFSIFYAKIHPPTEYKDGRYNIQKRIPLDIIESLAGARAPSLQKLEDQVNKNWTYIQIYGAIIMTMLLTLLLALITKR